MENNIPVLSICIPTYNSRYELESLVCSITEQLEFKNGSVEISVSDNASNDGTDRYLKKLEKDYPDIKININNTNFGYMPNFRKAIENSNGKFVWLVGSDDILVENSLKQLVNTISSEQDCEYFMVNNYFWTPPESIKEKYNFDSEISKICINDKTHHSVEKISDLIDKRPDAFTPMYSSIMLRKHWNNAFKVIEPKKHTFQTINNCSFFGVYIANNLFNKNGYYYGTPVILTSQNISWRNYLPLFLAQVLPDLYTLWSKNGANPELIKKYKRDLFTSYHKNNIATLIRGKSPGSHFFSIFRFFKNFFGIYSFADLLYIFKKTINYEPQKIKLQIKIFLSKIKRTVLHFISK